MFLYKDFDKYSRKSLAIYNKIVVDPIARIISLPIINSTNIKPYQITIFGLFLSFISAYNFYIYEYFIAALIFQFTVILDTVDGYVARIKNNGSVFGILFDGYSDIIRVCVNVFAIIFSSIDQISLNIILMSFLILNFAESWIDLQLISVKDFLVKKKNIKINFIEKKILILKNYLERRGLRTIFLYYQERIFCVLFIGPIVDDIQLWAIIGIILVILSIHIKMILDVALIKNMIINNTDETLRSSVI